MNKTLFVFPGQGSQELMMGKEIADQYQSARMVFQEIDSILNRKLSEIIWGNNKDELANTKNTQLAIMATSIATLRALEEETGRKIHNMCHAVAGHSLGEYSALCAANAISLVETVKILDERSQAMMIATEQSKGAMAAIMGADIQKVEDFVNLNKQNDILVIANDNSTSQVVISGSRNAIDRAEASYKQFGIRRFIRLPVSGAFHSPLMQTAEDKLTPILESIQINTPTIPILSSVSATIQTNPESIRKLLKMQITSGVKWRELTLEAENTSFNTTVEIGHGLALSGLIKKTTLNLQTFPTNGTEAVRSTAKEITR